MPSPSAQQWLDKAAEDEEVVSLICAASGPWASAAYHVQQSAEKLIKAALVEANIAPPKTHDLQQLLSLLPGTQPGASVHQAAAMLSAFAWMTRYPGGPVVEATDVVVARQHLATIKSWAIGTMS